MKYFLIASTAFAASHVPLQAQPTPPLQPAPAATVVLSAGMTAARAAEKSLLEKKYAETIAVVEAALKLPDLTGTEKVRLLKAAADASTGPGAAGMPAAQAYRQRIIDDPAVSNSAKIEALNALANISIRMQDGLDLQEMDVSTAVAAVNRALELPNLTTAERAMALTNIAKLAERQDKPEEARATYKQILALDVDARTKAAVNRLLADNFARDGKKDEALAIYTEQKFDLLPLYTLLGDDDKRFELAFKTLDDKSLPDTMRWTTFGSLPIFDRNSRYLDRLQELAATYVPGFLEKDPNRILFLKRFVIPAGSSPQFIDWAAPLMLKAPALSPTDYTAVRVAVMEALAAENKTGRFAAEASAVAADEKVPAATRLWARLTEIALKKGSTAELTAAMSAAGGFGMTEKSDALLRASKTLVRLDDVPAGESLYRFQQGLIVQQPRASITCHFVPRSPIDVGSWLSSPILKSKDSKAKLDRPYGDNLKFLLETDSAVMGRNTSSDTKKDSGDSDTDFSVSCDADGLYIFLNARDERVNEVANGLLSGGSFEIYLAPGKHNAYYTYLLNMPGNGGDPTGFQTMYPNPTYRAPSLKDGTLQAQTWRTDTGYANSLFLSWAAFYDKLPENGAAWQFDAIRWTRSGGLSFGGSESVHNRSSWGDIVFRDFSAQNLNAIKRNIVFKAVAKYKKAKTLIGPVGNWPDRQLGDPAFFKARVEPLFKTLDDSVAQVTNDMTAAQVEALFRDAVPQWMEIEYKVSDLRADYLKSRLMAQQ